MHSDHADYTSAGVCVCVCAYVLSGCANVHALQTCKRPLHALQTCHQTHVRI